MAEPLSQKEDLGELCAKALESMGIGLRHSKEENTKVFVGRDEEGFYEMSPVEGKLETYFNYQSQQGETTLTEQLLDLIPFYNSSEDERINLPMEALNGNGKYLEVECNGSKARVYYSPRENINGSVEVEFNEHFGYEFDTGVKGAVGKCTDKTF